MKGVMKWAWVILLVVTSAGLLDLIPPKLALVVVFFVGAWIYCLPALSSRHLLLAMAIWIILLAAALWIAVPQSRSGPNESTVGVR